MVFYASPRFELRARIATSAARNEEGRGKAIPYLEIHDTWNISLVLFDFTWIINIIFQLY